MRIQYKKTGEVITVLRSVGHKLIESGAAVDVSHLPDAEHENLKQALGLNEEEE